jgi:hypothetical protein
MTSYRTSYGFPDVTLDPGQSVTVHVVTKSYFRIDRLFMHGFMDDVRGTFKIKHTRLPLLNRENVIAYSNVTRHKGKRRTTVEYREFPTGNFVRRYRPENVVYKHTDPMSYVMLGDVSVGHVPKNPPAGGGVLAEVFGTGLRFPTAEKEMKVYLTLTSCCDIQVNVSASVFGWTRE